MKQLPENIGFIFDLDGVLVDTAKYHYEAWKALADELQVPFSQAENEQLKGVSRVDSLEKILAWGNKAVGQADKVSMLEAKNDHYLKLVDEMDANEMLPGARAFLLRARELNIPLALGSASKNAPRILNRLGITNLFTVIVDGNSVTNSKPDPEVFLKGAEAMGIPPNRCVVFEDAESGVEAAKRAGMKSVGIGSHNLDRADVVVSSLESITIETAAQLI